MFDHLDHDACLALDLALREARALHHNYVGTEHLLAGLAIQPGRTAGLLAGCGCGPDEIRTEIVSIIGRGHPAHRDPDALLASLGVDLGEVRRRVESTFGPDAVAYAALQVRPRRRWWPGSRWWPGCDQPARRHSALLGGQFGVAPRLEHVIELAVCAAAAIEASPVHLLVALLEEGRGVGCQILAARGVDLPALAATARAGLT